MIKPETFFIQAAVLSSGRNTFEHQVVFFIDPPELAPLNFEEELTEARLFHPTFNLEAAKTAFPLPGMPGVFGKGCRLEAEDRVWVFPVQIAQAGAEVSPFLNDAYYQPDEPVDATLDEEDAPVEADENNIFPFPMAPGETDFVAAITGGLLDENDVRQEERFQQAQLAGTGLNNYPAAIISERCAACPINMGCIEYRIGQVLCGAQIPPNYMPHPYRDS
jgi:hypothetical protein